MCRDVRVTGWLQEGSTVAGTTDNPAQLELYPQAQPSDVRFIIGEVCLSLSLPETPHRISHTSSIDRLIDGAAE